jgi:hypothetical protein
MSVQHGRYVIFGQLVAKPIVNLNGRRLVKLRLRAGLVARAFVQDGNEMQEWIIQPEGEEIMNAPLWKLGWQVGCNSRP